MGGRLSQGTDLPYDVRHPILLPPKGNVTSLVMRHAHHSLLHGSARNTVNLLRARFWFLKMNRLVRTYINKCVTCRKIDAPFEGQKMSDLPRSRFAVDHNPFEVTGADLFGPFDVKIGRASHKRWIALFMCHSSRAVHLEPVYSLEADSFINAVRRLLARRGQVKTLHLDNATNNRSAQKILSQAIDEWNKSELGAKLRQKGIDFVFNPPKAPHFGGVFEAMIRLCRRPLAPFGTTLFE